MVVENEKQNGGDPCLRCERCKVTCEYDVAPSRRGPRPKVENPNARRRPSNTGAHWLEPIPADILPHLNDLDQQTQILLLTLFFTNINLHLGEIIHRAWFYNELQQNRLDHQLIYAICAVSARLSPEVEHFQHLFSSNNSFGLASRMSFLDQELSSFTAVQILALFYLQELACGNDSRAWFFLASSLNMCRALGYNSYCERDYVLDDHKPPLALFADRELGRRLYWQLFIFERLHVPGSTFVTTTVDQRLQLPVHDTQVFSPIPVLNVTLESSVIPASLTPFAHLIRLVNIYGHVITYIQRLKLQGVFPPLISDPGRERILSMLKVWHRDLPLITEMYEFPKVQFMHILYHYSHICLYRDVDRPKARVHALSLLSVGEPVVNTPFVSLAIFHCAMVLLDHEKALGQCLVHLKRAKFIWRSVENFFNILSEASSDMHYLHQDISSLPFVGERSIEDPHWKQFL